MDSTPEIQNLLEQIEELKTQLSVTRRQRQPEPVADYDLHNSDGSTVRLSELFGEKRDLLVVHNMGKGCAYCTMWADGFIGALPHLQDRAAFVLVTPDKPEVQTEFAASRNWPFRMVSGAGSDFIKAMGYEGEDGYWPGISAFHLNDDGSIVRTGNDVFGPGDDYCAPWRMFDLLQSGAGDWDPKYRYS